MPIQGLTDICLAFKYLEISFIVNNTTITKDANEWMTNSKHYLVLKCKNMLGILFITKDSQE